MPRHHRALLAAGRGFERRMARAFLRTAQRTRAALSINDIALLVAGKNVRDLDALLRRSDVEDALQPLATIARDAFVKGGKLGAAEVNEVAA